MDPAHYEISVFYIFATIFLVLLNGFFVAAEFAMVGLEGRKLK
jgi:CBS domain containing-hemolysin-like protein